MNQYLSNKKPEFEKAFEFFQKEISTIRTGRANPVILNSVQVEAYGIRNPINAVASVGVSDSRTITVTPWDKNLVKDIEKAIVEAQLGLGVKNDGDKLHLTVPQMTEENRKDYVKRLNEKQEEARIRVRQVRDDIKEEIETAFTDKDISEDDKYRYLEELEEEVANYNNKIKELRDKKEEDIMTV
ncbi:MAG TPA: ribosome recycling factor [Patescibacteria group bacterium]|nr:ribosome recycling factor [Patescibacteria group bacterium]